MKNLTFKYYPSSILLSIVCFSIAIVLFVKHTIFFLTGSNNFLNTPLLNLLFEIVGMSGVLASIFIVINRFLMAKWFLKILNIPNIKGKYTGTLVSSYHIDDDSNKPNIKKFVKMKITQNLNGFYVKTDFYDNEFNLELSSSSESISHDIEAKDNGEFLIIYRYRNLSNAFHKDHIKYTLNQHDGIAQLYYNPKTKTLIGKYFNDSQERPSYGTINLNKK